MIPYMVFIKGAYVGIIHADCSDDAIDLAAVRFNNGNDDGIRVVLEEDFYK